MEVVLRIFPWQFKFVYGSGFEKVFLALEVCVVKWFSEGFLESSVVTPYNRINYTKHPG